MQHVDKLQHLVISLAGVCLIVITIAKLTSLPQRAPPTQAPVKVSYALAYWAHALRYPIAFSLAYAAGVVKEIGDGVLWPGNRDVADLFADLAGCLLGLLAARHVEHHMLGSSGALLPL